MSGRVTLTTPALRNVYLEWLREWRNALAAELARRDGVDSNDDLPYTVAAAVALAGFDAALTRWVDGARAEPLGPLLDQTFALASDTLNTARATPR